MPTLKIDTRGHLAGHFGDYFAKHKIIAKKYDPIFAHNKAEDVEVDQPKIVGEFKIGKDAHDYPRLIREIQEVYLQWNGDYRYLFLITPDPTDLMVMLSIVDKYFPLIRLKVYMSIDAAIAGFLEIIDKPPEIQNGMNAPIDYRMESKGLICSLAYLMDGITPDLAKFIFEYPTKEEPWFTSWQDFFIDPNRQWIEAAVMSESRLSVFLEEIMYKFYHDTEHKVLAANLAKAIYATYQPKLENP